MENKVAYFEKLDVWKKASQLAVEIYKVLDGCEKYGIKNQIQKSVVSISSNIAEGAERDSNADYIKFLYYSKGSAAELRTQLYIAQKIDIIENRIGIRKREDLENIKGEIAGVNTTQTLTPLGIAVTTRETQSKAETRD